MTKEQMDKMTSEAITEARKRYRVFNGTQSFENYANDMKDYLYLVYNRVRGQKIWTYEFINEYTSDHLQWLRRSYYDGEPISEAAVDFTFCCG